MSQYPRDELNALERQPEPAWLWDIDRVRIVWANRAGLALWGEQTVLDLIDRRLDDASPVVDQLRHLLTSLAPGASSQETLVLDISGRSERISADCFHVHLEDGRSGILVIGQGAEVTNTNVTSEEGTRASLIEAVLAEMPVPVVVFDRHTSLLYKNAAADASLSAEATVPGDNSSLLAGWLGDATRAEELMTRALMRGSFSEAEFLVTKYGRRAHRINARRLAAPVVGRLAVLFVLEDIDDRRRYELRQEDALSTIEALVSAADATFELDADGDVSDFGGAAEEILGLGVGVLVGSSWDDALSALEVEHLVPIKTRMAEAKPWREIVASKTPEAPSLAISAVPVVDSAGACVGFRGLILALGSATKHQALANAETDAAADPTLFAAPFVSSRTRSDEDEFRLDTEDDRKADPHTGGEDAPETPESSAQDTDAEAQSLGEAEANNPIDEISELIPEVILSELAATKASREDKKPSDDGSADDKAHPDSEPSERDSPKSNLGKVGRDDAATFSAIARALGVARGGEPGVGRNSGKADEADVASGNTNLRLVGGVEAGAKPKKLSDESAETSRDIADLVSLQDQNKPADQTAGDDGGPAKISLAALAEENGKPLLVHRHFDIVHANAALADLLGLDTVEAVLEDANLLNLVPDERARMFSLQSRFDDNDLPESGRIEGVALKLRRQDRTTLKVEAAFEEVSYGGEAAVLVVFDEVRVLRTIAETALPNLRPVPEPEVTQSGKDESEPDTSLSKKDKSSKPDQKNTIGEAVSAPAAREPSPDQPAVVSPLGIATASTQSGAQSQVQATKLVAEVTEEVNAKISDDQDLAPSRDEVTTKVEDQAALSAAAAREAELRAVINTAADGIATIDGDGKLITLNASAEAIFGHEAGEISGKKFTKLFTKKSAATLGTYINNVLASDNAKEHHEGYELKAKRPEGKKVPLFVTIGRMSVDGGTRLCAVVRDISQWKDREDGLRFAKEQAEEDSANKSDFLARISHELRTPLNAIIGFSEVMSEEKFGPIANDRYKGYLNDIRSSGGHLLSLINDLLDLSKIEAGKLDLNFTSVDISALIEQGVSIIQPQANQSRIIVRVSLPEQLPAVVADERSLRQIILNLLSNAVKFTPPGGQVILSAVVDEQGQLQLRVRDTGVGMSTDEIDRAMQPFRQIDGQGQTDHAGTGLGLPLTKALTEANRAEFKIESTPNAGTLVSIVFPTNRVLDG